MCAENDLVERQSCCRQLIEETEWRPVQFEGVKLSNWRANRGRRGLAIQLAHDAGDIEAVEIWEVVGESDNRANCDSALAEG